MVSTQTEQRSEEYNGWPNRETWAFMLWLSNDEGLYHATQDAIAEYQARYERADDYEPGEQYALSDTDARLFGEGVIDDLFEAVGAEPVADRSGGDFTTCMTQAESALRDIGSAWRIDWQRVADALNEWND